MDVLSVMTAIAFGSPAVAMAVVGGLFFLFLIRSIISHHQPRNRNHLPALPEVPGVPLLGNLLQLKEKKPYKTFTKWAETYGPIYSIKTGATSLVVLSSSQLAKEAMVTRFDSISTRKLSKALNILTSDKTMIAMSDYTDYHKMVKRYILTSVLGPIARNKHRVHRDTMSKNLSNQLHALALRSAHEPINLRKIIQSELFSLAFKQVMGKDIGSLYVGDLGITMEREEVFRVLVTDPIMGAIEVDWRDFFPYLKWIPNTGFEKNIERIVNRKDAVMKALIQEHTKRIDSGESLECFIDYLLSEAQPLTDKQLLMTLWEPIIETADTTMITTEWAMYELSKTPKKQERLYDEIQSVCGSQTITEEKLNQMPYLTAVFHETLRRHSPVAIMPLRYVHEDTELGGYHVPAGTELAINIYGCNMEKGIWENPEEWSPERFLAETEPIDLQRTMAFGGGKRVCAGAAQAMLIACMSIGRMVLEFEWRLKEDTGEDVNTLGLTTQKLNPMLAVIKPRKGCSGGGGDRRWLPMAAAIGGGDHETGNMDVGSSVGSAAVAIGGPAMAVAGGLSFLFLKTYLSQQHAIPNHLLTIPKVPGVPLLGNLLQLTEKKPYKTFTKWAETYGPIYSIKTGATSMVVVSSNHLAKEALVTKFDSITTRNLPNTLRILSVDKTMVALSDYDDHHKTFKRNVLTSVLGPVARKKHRVHRDTMAENLSNRFHALAPNSSHEAVNLREVFQSELFSLALKQAFGRDFKTIYVADLGITMTFEEVFQVLVIDPMNGAIDLDWRDFFPYLKWIPNTGFEKKIEQIVNRREAVMKAMIQEHTKRIQSGESLNSFIDYLLSEAQPLTENQLLMSIWEMIIETADTTMVTTEWAMYELSKNLKQQDRLYEEIRNVCGSEKITEEMLCKMPYLSAVFHETLRKHSPISVIPARYVRENIELGGYHVPAGSEVTINIYGCNMEKEIWENPEEWNPERFLADNEPIDLQRTLAFGGGKRVCSGAMQAMLITCMGIGRMVQEFEWRLKEDTGEDVNTVRLTTQKLNPLLAIIKPRKLYVVFIMDIYQRNNK
ncbi:hypothetical protein OSB04_003340 [Centaurea solstitialis]|uniref:Ent-kaurene oxidase n=1 Tax=Centaurea solstitialis TaxID=347529 RepID=A0AA38TUY7_9ASTR|nr:hypothetical protein OSB04_003340 [Centaurea solstitialis]